MLSLPILVRDRPLTEVDTAVYLGMFLRFVVGSANTLGKSWLAASDEHHS